jgi:hypothetical protein
MLKNYDIEDEATLRALFPFMFSGGREFSFEFYKGWFPLFAGLCIEIDSLLGRRDLLRWTQTKEKFGVYRMHYDLDESVSDELSQNIRDLVSAVQRESARTCMVCGQPGQTSDKQAWIVTACAHHEPGEISRRGGASFRELTQVPKNRQSPRSAPL